jgi:hypothetical protein
MTIVDSGEEHSNEIQDTAVSGKTGAAGGLLRKRRLWYDDCFHYQREGHLE